MFNISDLIKVDCAENIVATDKIINIKESCENIGFKMFGSFYDLTLEVKNKSTLQAANNFFMHINNHPFCLFRYKDLCEVEAFQHLSEYHYIYNIDNNKCEAIINGGFSSFLI